ncbi:MAG: hydantoinase B/oxoprolinase family protein [Chloroflexi bacterium]|nr:hydantoinase B/oxoprolinase family protein [Chloroflexota bacterium]
MSTGALHESMAFDPISLEIIWSRLISIANQAAATLLRTSFSTIVHTSRDFRFVLTDARGESFAQSDEGVPMFVTTFPAGMKEILKVFPSERIEPGDVIIVNDPWLSSGHYPDIHLATPVFHRGRLVGFSGSVVHISDIGGRFGPHDATEVFEEGLCLPIMKLYKRGVPTDEIFQILAANVRAPDMQIGDVRAMVAGNEVGARLLVELMEEYGLDDLTDISRVIQARVEQVMRDAIRAIPDGAYDHETWVDGFQEDIRITSRITVKGDELTVDYTGSSPQTMTASVNCVLYCTEASTLFPLEAVLAPHVPTNEGVIRPISIIAPEGSILNATRPAPVDVRTMITHLLPDHIMGALARVIPDKVTAEMGTRWMLLADRAPKDGKRVLTSFFQAGGLGAAHHRDGASGRLFPITACHTPVELFEQQTRLLVSKKSLRAGSGGPGRFRGGCGQEIVIENLDETRVDFTFYRPRVRNPAQGIFGGRAGEPGAILHNGQPLRKGVLSLEQGDVAVLLTPAGGGFGDPQTRDLARVLADVADGYVGVEQARDQYGVVVDPATLKVKSAEADPRSG